MKIMYVITTTDLGGAENYLLELIQKISLNNCVKVVSLKSVGDIGKKISLQKNVEVISLNVKKNISFSCILNLRKEIKKFNPEVIHAMLYRGIEYTRMACIGLNIPVFTTFHCDLSKKFFLTRLIDRLLKFKDVCTIAESNYTFNYLKNHQKYNQKKLYLINNGVDENKFYSDEKIRKESRSLYSYKPKDIVFICVSRIVSVKNLLTVCRSFYNLTQKKKNVYLVIVGEGEYKKTIELFIKEYNLENQIKLVGYQTNINDWLNLADVFIQYSLEESLPLSLLEAIKVGKPCIVSNVGDMPKWVNHGINGYVGESSDFTLLSCFMDEMCNQKKREFMEKNSLQIAKEIKHRYVEYMNLYKKFSRENR